MAQKIERGTRKWCVTLLVLALVAVGGLTQDEAELAYDDGTAEASRAFAAAGSGFAVRFTAPPEGAVLLRAKFYIAGLRGGPGPIEVHVWDADQVDLIAPFPVTPAEAGWFEVDLSDHGLTLSKDFYVGYVQLSAETHPWIGLDTSTIGDSSYSVPGWSPVLPLGSKVMIRVVVGPVLGQPGPAVQDEVELVYDDGTAETGRGFAVAGSGYAVRFTLPTGGAKLLRAMVYVTGFRGEPAPIEIHLWDTEHRDLIAPFQVTPTKDGWFEVDLSVHNLTLDKDFFVGYVQTDGDAYPWIGLDATAPGDRSYSVPAWSPVLPAGSNIMIRVVVRGN